MVWYAHLFENFPQFVVIHTVKGFGIVNKAVDAFLDPSLGEHFLNRTQNSTKISVLQKSP